MGAESFDFTIISQTGYHREKSNDSDPFDQLADKESYHLEIQAS